MAHEASWNESECRDVLDALACAEAVSCAAPSTFLDGVRSEHRQTLLPQVDGCSTRRVMHSRGVNKYLGYRLFKAQISYEPLPSPGKSQGKAAAPETVLVYAFWAPCETYDEVIKSTTLELASAQPPSRSILAGQFLYSICTMDVAGNNLLFRCIDATLTRLEADAITPFSKCPALPASQ